MKSAHSLWSILFTRVAGLTFQDWAGGTTWVEFELCQPTTPTGYFFQCTTAGAGHAGTEPTWPTTVVPESFIFLAIYFTSSLLFVPWRLSG